MRSVKELPFFPYKNKLVCFVELFPSGKLEQLFYRHQKKEALCRAMSGDSKIVAVLPGTSATRLILIDDFDAFRKSL